MPYMIEIKFRQRKNARRIHGAWTVDMVSLSQNQTGQNCLYTQTALTPLVNGRSTITYNSENVVGDIAQDCWAFSKM